MKIRQKAVTVLATVCAFMCLSAQAGDVPASTGPVVPGEWNASFTAGKKYAEEHGIPMLLFWANPGCGNCAKMAKAVAKDDFVAWMKSTGYVFVFSSGTNGENGDAKVFAWNSSQKFPYMSLYYPTETGWRKKNFSGLSGQMPSQKGSGLQGKLISSVEYILSGGAGTDTYGDEWNHARNLTFAAKQDDTYRASLEVKLGKAKSKTLTSSVKVTMSVFGGKTVKFSGKVTASNKPFSFSKSGYTLTLKSESGVVSGTLVGNGYNCTLEEIKFGGSTSANCFVLEDFPSTYRGSPILEFGNSVKFTTTGTKWTFPAAGKVKWDSGKFVNTSASNPLGAKLKYKSSSGYFSGKCYLYAQTGTQKAKQITLKVSGYVINGIGYGQASASGLSIMTVSIVNQ